MADKIAFVTGAASGIGEAVSRQLRTAGMRVAMCDINTSQGERIAQEIGGYFIHCDVARFDSVEAAVRECASTLGAPDYAHLNAGIMTVPPGEAYLAIEEVSVEQYRRITSVNMDGVFFGLKALVPRMKAKGAGAITITASVAGFVPLGIDPLYGMSKHGIIGLGRSVAAANAGGGLRVNVICPGVVETPILPHEFRAPQVERMPASVLAEEVADLLMRGENGEVRVKLADKPSFRVEVADVNVLSEGA